MTKISNENMKALRFRAHEHFDKLWNDRTRPVQITTRSSAYNWLARHMNLKPDECHFEKFTPEQCRRAIFLVMKRIRKYNMNEVPPQWKSRTYEVVTEDEKIIARREKKESEDDHALSG